MMPADRIVISVVDATFYMIPHIFMAYTLMYFVIPRFIVHGKYFYGAISVALICAIAGFLSACIATYVLSHIREVLFPQWIKEFRTYTTNSIWLSLLAGLRGGITIGGMAAAIKLMKYWYMKEQRNLELQKENSESQLQLLKAQIHPHFLFNTLNNIYSYTQGISPTASKLVMGLGDMLRYMLYECNQPLVPLEKELQMLDDYITLERIRYGNRLDVHVEVPKDADSLVIAPLLLLPFVENCFKHGASHMIDQPWVNLYVSITDAEMQMKLLNGKPANYQAPAHYHGIGIENVTKRLDLLYAGKYSLDIQEEEEVFIVNLRLLLEKRKAARESKNNISVAANA
jgi:sensor histidine kinase YesM